MSYFNPGSASAAATGSILRSASLGGMAGAVVMVLAAGLLAATYQIIQDETRIGLAALRARARYRVSRNEAILNDILGSGLDMRLQYELLGARNVYRRTQKILAKRDLLTDEKLILRESLRNAHNLTED